MISQSVTLFIAVSLMLLYRTIDLFTVHEKIAQLLQKHSWMNEKISFRTKRLFLKNFGNKSRIVVVFAMGLSLLYKEFISALMIIYFIILMVVGYSAILNGNNSSSSTLVVAFSTACVSLIGSVTNFVIERIKTNI